MQLTWAYIYIFFVTMIHNGWWGLGKSGVGGSGVEGGGGGLNKDVVLPV